MATSGKSAGKATRRESKPNIIVTVLFFIWCAITLIGTFSIVFGGGIATSTGDWVARLFFTAIFWVVMAVLFFALDWIPDQEFDFAKRGLGAVLNPRKDDEDDTEEDDEEPVRSVKPDASKRPAPTSRRTVVKPVTPPAPPKTDDDDDEPVLI
ncbi:MAG: hypothetical protein QY314_03635 [Candidatus Dojkabacteria bacterium]|nr:MAG: hypothetical protein QY314_03635 [Candidatus Dojkabacteria bacterium]